MAGFFTATTQAILPLRDPMYDKVNEDPRFPKIKKTKAGQYRWNPDTIYYFSKQDLLHPYYREIFNYNTQGLLAGMIEQTQIDNSWINNTLYTLAYDSNNNLITVQIQDWENNTWENSGLDTYTYDSNNNILTDGVTYTYDSDNNMLTKESSDRIYTLTYDSNNNILTFHCQLMINNSWVTSRLYTYTYDSNNNVQIMRDDSYIEPSLFTYTYDSDNNMLTSLWQDWGDNSWKNTQLSTCTYDSNNNLLTILIQEWKNDSWMNLEQHQWIYDENGNSISVERLVDLNEKPYQWYGTHYYMYLYYNNMQNEFKYEEWFGGLYKMTSSFIKVSGPTAIKEPQATPELNAISIYPNPTMGKLRITNSKLRIKDIQIFNVTGNKIPLSVEKAGDEIDISHLPAGTYFVQVTTEKGIVTKKIVKLRISDYPHPHLAKNQSEKRA